MYWGVLECIHSFPLTEFSSLLYISYTNELIRLSSLVTTPGRLTRVPSTAIPAALALASPAAHPACVQRMHEEEMTYNEVKDLPG
jgi:hypothetical protein